jgi:hypothetical protein
MVGGAGAMVVMQAALQASRYSGTPASPPPPFEPPPFWLFVVVIGGLLTLSALLALISR